MFVPNRSVDFVRMLPERSDNAIDEIACVALDFVTPTASEVIAGAERANPSLVKTRSASDTSDTDFKDLTINECTERFGWQDVRPQPSFFGHRRLNRVR